MSTYDMDMGNMPLLCLLLLFKTPIDALFYFGTETVKNKIQYAFVKGSLCNKLLFRTARNEKQRSCQYKAGKGNQITSISSFPSFVI